MALPQNEIELDSRSWLETERGGRTSLQHPWPVRSIGPDLTLFFYSWVHLLFFLIADMKVQSGSLHGRTRCMVVFLLLVDMIKKSSFGKKVVEHGASFLSTAAMNLPVFVSMRFFTAINAYWVFAKRELYELVLGLYRFPAPSLKWHSLVPYCSCDQLGMSDGL